MKCLECERDLPASKATGRPRVYCGNACRRSAEHRIARARRLVEAIEKRLMFARVESKCAYHDVDGWKRRVKALEGELETVEKRLRDLLGRQDEPVESAL